MTDHATRHTVTVTKPLGARIIITDPQTGEDLFVFDAPTQLAPGDTVTWTYPAEGLAVTLS